MCVILGQLLVFLMPYHYWSTPLLSGRTFSGSLRSFRASSLGPTISLRSCRSWAVWDLETKMGALGSACLLVGHLCTVGKPLRTAVSLHSLARSCPPHPGLLLDRTASVVRTCMSIPVLPSLIQRGGALSSLSLSVFTNSFSDHGKPGSLYPQMHSPIVQGAYFLHPPHLLATWSAFSVCVCPLPTPRGLRRPCRGHLCWRPHLPA